MNFRSPREKNDRYLSFVRSLVCVLCGDNVTVEAAHVSFSDFSVCKRGRGLGEKAWDMYALPLCGQHHRDQHDAGDERAFWEKFGVDPVKVALRLFVAFLRKDHADAMRVCEANRR